MANQHNPATQVIIRLAFIVDENAEETTLRTTLGSFANRIVRRGSNYNHAARELCALLLSEEKEKLAGYVIDDGSKDFISVSRAEVKPIFSL